MGNMERLERIVARLPEAERVDVEAWGDHPTFRVNGKNFVFSDDAAHHLSLKLTMDEAAAVVATDPQADPAGYGLGRHGWIALTVDETAEDDRWQQVEEWVRTSYTLVAPRRLARRVIEDDEAQGDTRLGCMACDNNARVADLPPRELVAVNEHWRVAHSFDSALAGWLVVMPRRHVTALHELTAEEVAPLGPLLHRLSAALVEVIGCQKAYLMFFAEKEGFSHLHIHVVPRMAGFGPDERGPGVFRFLQQGPEDWIPTDDQDRLAILIGSVPPAKLARRRSAG